MAACTVVCKLGAGGTVGPFPEEIAQCLPKDLAEGRYTEAAASTTLSSRASNTDDRSRDRSVNQTPIAEGRGDPSSSLGQHHHSTGRTDYYRPMRHSGQNARVSSAGGLHDVEINRAGKKGRRRTSLGVVTV